MYDERCVAKIYGRYCIFQACYNSLLLRNTSGIISMQEQNSRLKHGVFGQQKSFIKLSKFKTNNGSDFIL